MTVAEKHHHDRIEALSRVARAVGPPALLLVIYIGMFWKLTLTSQYTWLESPDFANQVLPWYQYEAGEFHLGHFPLWDPHLWGGQPLLGQMQPGLSFPFNWILFALPLRHGWIRQVYLHWYFVLIHYFGGLFCYWLCRDLGRTTTAALFAGAAFGVGGFVGTTDWPMMLNGAIWAPLVFLFFFRVLRNREPLRNAAFSGACLGMAFLSGHHQIPIFITLAVSGCWIYYLILCWKSRTLLISCSAACLFGTLLALVSAFLMLPALEYGKLAIRWVGSANAVGWSEVVPYPVHGVFSLFPITLLGIVIPGIAVNTVPYVGWTVLALAFIGLLQSWENRTVRVLSAVALGGILYSLAPFNVFHGILYALIPLVEKARSSSMAEFIFHFAIVSLSAFGIDACLELRFALGEWPGRVIRCLLGAAVLLSFVALLFMGFQATKGVDPNNLVMAAFAATLLAGAIRAGTAGNIAPATARSLLLLLMLLESGIVTGAGYRNRDQPEYLLSKMARDADIVHFLQTQPTAVRVEIDEQAVPYNFGDFYGIDQFGGYLASLTSNVNHIQGDYWARMLFGTNFWIGTKPLRDGQIERYTSASGLKVYENPEAFPRVWSVHRAVAIRQGEELPRLEAGGAKLRQETFLREAAPQLETCPGAENLAVILREPNRVVIEADMGCKGMVELGETYFPGWKAAVDGRPERVWETYGALRGVIAGAGKHRIEMVYRPTSVIAGAALTGLGLLGVLGLVLFPKLLRLPANLN